MALLLAAATGPAEAASKIGGKGFSALSRATPEEAAGAFVGKTVIMQRPKDGLGYGRDRTFIPVSGRFVAYFSPDGSLLVWGKDNGKVIKAQWGTAPSQKFADGTDTGTLLCFNFVGGRDKVVCVEMTYIGSSIFDSADGNIFKLKAGAAVPAALPSNPGKLDRISAVVGQGQ